MVRFAHISDVHLGGWKQQPLQDLNLQSFKKAIESCISERVEFVLIAGDLFDSAYPPIEILKEAFSEFKKLKEAGIPCFIVAGSHDYSVSGKTFLDVLERAGFCKNVEDWEDDGENIKLNPVIFHGVAVYGYPGKKSGLEVADLRRIKLNDAPGMFKIFMFHTTLDKAKGTIPIDAIEADSLPKADYYALGHLHIDFQYKNFIYPGPIFPNNFQELEDLNHGSFYIVNTDLPNPLRKIELQIKNVEKIYLEVNDATTATEKIIEEIKKRDIIDKIILLRIKGTLEHGKQSEIKYQKIEEFASQKGAYFLLRNTHELKIKEVELEVEVKDSANIEEEVIESYSKENPSNFNDLISQLMNTLSLEKQEDEKSIIFENRLLDSTRKILGF
jgi:hypothetical protein